MERDEETGLYYYGVRYYVSWLGRWCNSDPIGIQDGLNVYIYVHGSPVTAYDPNGRGDIRTHFYFSYLQAVAAGFPPKEAQRIAAFAWLPDEVRKYSATGTLFPPTGKSNLYQQGFHALFGTEVSSTMVQYTVGEKLHQLEADSAEFGVYFHIFFDAYQHTIIGKEETYYPENLPEGVGHGEALTAPDDPRRSVFKKAAVQSYQILVNKAQTRGTSLLTSDQFEGLVNEFQNYLQSISETEIFVGKGGAEFSRQIVIKEEPTSEEAITWLQEKINLLIQNSGQNLPIIEYLPDEGISWEEFYEKIKSIGGDVAQTDIEMIAINMVLEVKGAVSENKYDYLVNVPEKVSNRVNEIDTTIKEGFLGFFQSIINRAISPIPY